MTISVTLPGLGESVTEGTVTRWLKAVGDTVAVDEPLLEVSTDKVDTEIPSPAAGTLLEIRVVEDQTVAVGTVLAVVGETTTPTSSPVEVTKPPVAPQPTPAIEPLTPASVTLPAPPASANDDRKDTSVSFPELGESVTEGTVTRWLKAVGESVAADEPLLEVSTDKVDTEIPSPVAGVLLEISVGEDETVAVGAQLAVIRTESVTSASEPLPTPAPAQPGAARTIPPAASVHVPSPSRAGADQVPANDRAAAPLEGVEPASEDDKAVVQQDREPNAAGAASTSAAAPAAAASTTAAVPKSALRGKTEPLSRLRKIIASRMIESLQTSAQLTQVVEADVTVIGRLRASVKAEFPTREGVKLSYFPFLAKAAIDALKVHPKLNATIDAEKAEVTYFDHEHLAIAVDTPRGLLSPVIKDAGDLMVGGLARKIADVADRARTNKLSPDELSGGTFTVTNTGSVGALFDTPIINQPQVSILGTGTVVKRPVVIDDPNLGETIAVREMVYLSLTYDHRLVDGADAARFLSYVKVRLEAGQFDV